MARKNRTKARQPAAVSDVGEIKNEEDSAHSVPGNLLSLASLVLFLGAFSLVSIGSIQQQSPTVDEPIHLLSGYASLKWGDYRANPEHPPLAKLWAALPLLAINIRDPRPTAIEWDIIPTTDPHTTHTATVAAKLFFVDNDGARLFFWAKLQIVLLALLLGLFIYRWSCELFGIEAALASLFLYGLDPNILAHSQIVHTDIAFSALFFIGSYYFWHALNKLTWFNLALTTGFFGLAATTKYAYLAILAVWGALGVLRVFSSRPQELCLGGIRTVSRRRDKALLVGGIIFCSLVAAYCLIWAAYGFRFSAVAGDGRSLPMANELLTQPRLRGLVSWLAQLQLFPEAWLYGQLFVLNNLQRKAYLFGAYSDQGFWLYFPVAFAVKTPLPTLILFLGTLVLWWKRKIDRAKVTFLLLAVAVYFSLAVFSHLSIGVRHILPIYPFLFVMIGGTVAQLWRVRTVVTGGAITVLGLWCVWSTINTYPHFLAYFNELAGGARQGHKILLDSNLDWGQDLKGLKAWMTQNQVKKIQFVYFGFHNDAEPRYFGIDAQFLPGSWVSSDLTSNKFTDPSDYLAISANHLFGRHYIRGERRVDFLKPFLSLSPTAIIGHSIYVYRISQAIVALRETVTTYPESAQAHADLGSLLENQGDVADAEKHYRQAVQQQSAPTKALYNLGMILAKQDNVDEAIEFLQRARTASPGDEDIHYDLALALAVRGDIEHAMGELRQTILIEPLYTKAYYNLAILLARQGQNSEAVAALRDAVKANPLFAKAHYQIGVMLGQGGAHEEAIWSYRQALQVDPSMAEAHESLGKLLASMGRTDEGVKHLEAAVRLIKSRPLAR
ncbi:MAG: tetratricopeptide repeat protein [Deltaproteobacteria bacterium]|nr:tetratricopeptide repeat protein [Deltaproteobacteria bacterium]